MTTRLLTSTILAAALVTGGVSRASADIGDAIAGGIIGGVIVGAIQNGQNSRRPTRTVVPSAAREQAREVQVALNHFFFNVGVPDGVLGRQSRAAISQYQAYLGFPVTGTLSEFERQVLVTAYQRAQMGGPQVMQVVSSHPNGMRGLLEVTRDDLLGVSRPQMTAAAPQTQPQPEPAAAAPQMPNLFGGQGAAGTQVSLSSHCNRVGLVTSANGGYTDLASMSDPVFALNEQFCLARGYAIAEGEALATQAGASPQQVAQQCAGMEPLLQPHVTALATQPRDMVLAGMTQFVLGSGMNPQELAANARVCLSSGYATDNMTVAIGSALILAAVGELGYGELPAHHLMQGIGVPQRRDFAADWFRASLPADGAAATTVSFQPGPAARNALIRGALDAATGAAPAAVAPAVAPAVQSRAPQPQAQPQAPQAAGK